MKQFALFRIICVIFLLSLVATGCGQQAAIDTKDSDELSLTLEQLSEFDGKDGQPAYIAIDGVIYDVSNVPQWANGDHNGFSAGNDLTEKIKNVSPHGVSKLKGLPIVGKLVD